MATPEQDEQAREFPDYDRNDPGEAGLVASLTSAILRQTPSRRKQHTNMPWTREDLGHALATLRAHRRGEGGTTFPTGTPTPRDEVVGGKLAGTPEPFPARAHADKQEGYRIQQASMQAMAAAGYRAYQQPWVLQSDGLAGFHAQPHAADTPPPPDPDPDLRLGWNIADVLAPRSSSLDQVRNGLSDKVSRRQAFHLVLNLGRTRVTQQEVETILQRKPITGLRELFVIQQDGAIYRIFPVPELIAPDPGPTPR